MDRVSESRINEVHPALAAKVREMADILAKEDIHVRVTQGLRSWDEQAALYAQGRSAPGPVVTNAPPGASWHNYGLAVDLVPMTELGPDWNVGHPVWRRMIEVGESLGLVSGAAWRTFPDFPHFQLTGTFPISPDVQAKDMLSAEGISAIWKASGLEGETNV